ncbi:MAG TPA: pyridoxamine 5'-phosphate oxidase family protein [Chitinophagaceae bacterium]
MMRMNEEGQKKLRELVEDIKTCMFTTTDENCVVFSRPMFTVSLDNEFNLWFFVNESSDKMKDIMPGKEVTLVYSHPGKNAYMNITGHCTISYDREKMKAIWTPALKAWFPEGIDSPSVCLLKVVIDEAGYWDNSSNDMVCLHKNEPHITYQDEEETEDFIPQTSHW